MEKHKTHRPFRWMQVLSIVIIGLGIGWLMGLSASPVVAGVITSLLGIGVGIVTGLHSVRQPEQVDQPSALTALDARPVALLVISIALAATCGMVARAYRIFEPVVIREATWKAMEEGRPDNIPGVNAHSALLFKVPQSECSALLSLKGNNEAFIDEMKHSSFPSAQNLVARINDPQALMIIVEELCKKH